MAKTGKTVLPLPRTRGYSRRELWANNQKPHWRPIQQITADDLGTLPCRWNSGEPEKSPGGESQKSQAPDKFNCGNKLENAHSAEADTLATEDVFRAQTERNLGETVEDLQGNTLDLFENNMKKIHALVNERMVDLAGRFVFNSQGQEIFNFGKHKGKTIEQALKEEPGYHEWMMKGDFPLDTKRKLTQIKLHGFKAR